MTDLTFTPELRSRLQSHLKGLDRRSLAAPGRRSAAVAVVVVPAEDGQASVVLTVRAATLRRHSGQWAFPGGRVDPGESTVETALRELAEEVGLELGPDDVLGGLDDFETRSGFVISPVVFWGPRDVNLQPDPREVASVHLVPAADVGVPEHLVLERVPESDQPILALRLLGTTIFAPTAAILYQFSEVAVHGRDTRVAHYEQPRFAWR